MTLTISGPVRVLIINLYCGDAAVEAFIASFRASLHRPDIHIVATFSPRSWKELYDGLSKAYVTWRYNTVLFVSHGDDRGDPSIRDADLERLPSTGTTAFRSWICWAEWARASLMDRLIILAICSGGSVRNAQAIMKRGLGMHLLTAFEGQLLNVGSGSNAMAHFLNSITDINAMSMDERTLAYAMDKTERSFPSILDLWLYPGAAPYRVSGL